MPFPFHKPKHTMTIRSTLISRLSDGLPLVESIEDGEIQKDFHDYKSQVRAILKTLAMNSSDTRCTIEVDGPPFHIHYWIDNGVVYLCLTDKLFPKRLAFSYLDQIGQEFYSKHSREIDTVTRPYAFIHFDTAIQKIKKTFQDAKTQQNLTRLNEDLKNVTMIMTKNIQDVLQRGEKIDRLGMMSSHLTSESKRYAKETRNLNLQMLYRKYGVPIILILFLLIVLYLFVM
jgi:vesicle transport protein SEC22